MQGPLKAIRSRPFASPRARRGAGKERGVTRKGVSHVNNKEGGRRLEDSQILYMRIQ